MYAIFKSGGKQYEARPGTVVRLEKLPGNVGDTVVLDEVLMFCDGDQVRVGQPLLQDLAVQGKIIEQGRHRKILVFKYKRRKDYQKKQGHRQSFTAVRIDGIGAPAAAESPAEAEA